MTALPSFVQLMESLGLSQENEYAGRDGSRRDGPGAPPPSSFLQFSNPFESSYSSIHEGRRNSSNTLNPAMMSGHDILSAARERRGSSGSARSARYTPYSPSSRRTSLSESSESSDVDKPIRIRVTPPPNNKPNGTISPPLEKAVKSENISVGNVGNRHRRTNSRKLPDSCAPISTYVRRRSPQASPTVAQFPASVKKSVSMTQDLDNERDGNCKPSPRLSPAPVALPTLPLSIVQSFSSYTLSTATTTTPTATTASTATTTTTPSITYSSMDSDMEDVVVTNVESKNAKVTAGPEVRGQRLLSSEMKTLGRLYGPVGVRISSARSCATQSAMAIERTRVAPLA